MGPLSPAAGLYARVYSFVSSTTTAFASNVGILKPVLYKLIFCDQFGNSLIYFQVQIKQKGPCVPLWVNSCRSGVVVYIAMKDGFRIHSEE